MLQEPTSRTELSELGEFGLIKHLTQHVKINNASSIKGIGDDAAVLDFDKNQLVLTTDMLVENVHFDLMYMPLKHLGYKSVMVNASDVCAMNAKPTQITIAVALSNRFSVESLEELYEGILMACKKLNIDLVGGDTTNSKSGLVISVTAVGSIEKGGAIYRNTAKETDLIVVSGDLGAAYVGLQLLEREKEVYLANPKIQPDLEGNDYILERQLKPEARYDIVELLKALNVKPTSMIDISDGLSSELLHICDQSAVGATIYEDKLPIDPTTYSMAREFNLDPTTCVLNGGEDYELLFTIAISDYNKIKANPSLTVIGHITNKEQGVHLVSKNNAIYPITAQGWNPIKDNKAHK